MTNQGPITSLFRTASDMDGVLHLVALVEDVDRWKVVVDGERRDPERSGFPSPYDPRLLRQPCWVIDGAALVEVEVDGERATVPLVEELPVPGDVEARPELDWALPTIRSLGDRWRTSEHRPTLSGEAAQHWDALIEWWAHESSLPVPSRSGSTDRRGSVADVDGRQIVFVDNSPAQWVFARAVLQGWRPDEATLERAVLEEMPVAFAFRRGERDLATFTSVLGSQPNTQSEGWQLHHIQPVGARRNISTWTRQEVEQRAVRLLSPSNMFVLPRALAGLGEIPAFIDAMRSGG